MNAVTFYAILLLVSIHSVQSLKCRSNDPKEEEEYRRIVQKCSSGKFGKSKNNDDNSSRADSNDSQDDDSSADESIYEHDFFSGAKKNRDSGNNNRNNNDNNDNNRRMESGSYRNSMNNSTRNRNMRNQNSNSGMQQRDNNSRFSNDGDDDLQCLAQCAYAELNAVDQRGYPERMALIAAMNRRNQDPVLRDFQEESIVECFHFLSSMSNLNKCEFSERLSNCFLDKARERCDDIGK